jgi:hypothetical protein
MCTLVPVLVLGVIPHSRAAEIRVVSPQAYASTEGESAVGADPDGPFRYQQAFPASDFAALGGQPYWVTAVTVRPDQSVTAPRTVTFPDNQIRLSTTAASPANLNSSFDANFGPNVTEVYRGPVSLVADAGTLASVPRDFYQLSIPLAPFLYDPRQGNLLFDVIAWGGMPTSTLEDKGSTRAVDRTALYGPATATSGDRSAAGIYQFTFVPVPEPSAALLGGVFALLVAVARRGR